MKTNRQWIIRKAFTLLELMIVISIISILVALLFAGIKAVIASSKKAQAQVAVQELANACRYYYNTYGLWPGTNTTITIVNSGTHLVNCLRGQETNLNPRGVVFKAFRERELKGSGASLLFVDPFGGTGSWQFLPYHVYFDTNGDGLISSADGGSPSVGSITQGVIIWSPGPNRLNNWGSSDDITTWK